MHVVYVCVCEKQRHMWRIFHFAVVCCFFSLFEEKRFSSHFEALVSLQQPQPQLLQLSSVECLNRVLFLAVFALLMADKNTLERDPEPGIHHIHIHNIEWKWVLKTYFETGPNDFRNGIELFRIDLQSKRPYAKFCHYTSSHRGSIDVHTTRNILYSIIRK